MSTDLARVLHDVVDETGPGPWGAAGTAARLRERVRRRRTVRATTAAVASVAACALGIGVIGVVARPAPPPAVVAAPTPSPTASAPPAGGPPTATPAPASTSPLCGARADDLAADAAGVHVTIGSLAEGDLIPLALTGRSLGPDVPVWLGGVPSGTTVAGTDLVVVRDDVVVGVADGGATTLLDGGEVAAVTDLAGSDRGTGTLAACGPTDGLAGDVVPSGPYQLHAVTAYTTADGTGHRAVSEGIALSLLPEAAPVATGAADLPDGYPLAAVPLVGGEVVSGRATAGGGWEVVLAVSGTDALQRAGSALGVPDGGTRALWNQLGSGGAFTLDGGDAVPADDRAAAALRAAERSAARSGTWAPGVLAASSDGETVRVDLESGFTVTVRSTPGGYGVEQALVYRVVPTTTAAPTG